MTEREFVKFVESNNVLTGKFDFPNTGDSLMCLNFTDKMFVNFELHGGDFASGSFVNCTFNRVLFKNLSLVGVSFLNCHFIDCKFSNIESDFSLSNCRVDKFTLGKEA